MTSARRELAGTAGIVGIYICRVGGYFCRAVSETASKPEIRFRGIGVAPGIAHAPVVVHWEVDEEVPVRPISVADLPEEIARFEAALMATRAEILEMQKRIENAIGARDASIFDAHLLVVEDRTLIDEVLRTIESSRQNVEHVFATVYERYCHTLEQIDDPYLRERVVDIQDVSRRILRHLLGKGPRDFATSENPHILAARILTPSDTSLIDREKVLGFATEAGSKTSHSAIMARSLGIPAVAGLHEIFGALETGDSVLLDGTAGLLILNPGQETLKEYGRIEQRREAVEEQLDLIRDTSSTTRDGQRVVLSANIGLPEEMAEVAECGAEGVGLFRSEFLFLNREDIPTEDEQMAAYRTVAERASPHAVVIRTLDVGGDKLAEAFGPSNEESPFLGCRAIRYCLERPEFFKIQLRAILRASAFGKIRLMYPMISGVGELRRANALLEECKTELSAAGTAFDTSLPVGIMIEIPSAALSADHLAREVSFFSIGTNDLIQYTLAVDRMNDAISSLFEPTHPAVLRLLRTVVDAARAAGIGLSVCGEMAGDVIMTPLLLGLGVREMSAAPPLVLRVKKAIQSLDVESCERLMAEARERDSGEDILHLCEQVARSRYAELLD